MVKWIFNDKAQIGYDRRLKRTWGYHDMYKEGGEGIEDGIYIKIFNLGHAWICWCPWEEYRIKYLHEEMENKE